MAWSDESGHQDSGEALGGSHDITDVWLDYNDEILDWCVSLNEPSNEMTPATTAPPCSPTAVDGTHSESVLQETGDNVKRSERAIKFELDVSQELQAPTDDLGDQNDQAGDAEMVKSSPLADIGELFALLDDWVDVDHKETQRRRQRMYEKSYRQRKQAVLQTNRIEWAELEIKFHELLQKRSRAYRVGRRSQRTTLHDKYIRSLQKTRALQCDGMLLTTTRFWKRLFALRNYTVTEDELENGLPEDREEDELLEDHGDAEKKEHEEILQTVDRWASIDLKILGASKAKPFQPPHFEFQW